MRRGIGKSEEVLISYCFYSNEAKETIIGNWSTTIKGALTSDVLLKIRDEISEEKSIQKVVIISWQRFES